MSGGRVIWNYCSSFLGETGLQNCFASCFFRSFTVKSCEQLNNNNNNNNSNSNNNNNNNDFYNVSSNNLVEGIPTADKEHLTF